MGYFYKALQSLTEAFLRHQDSTHTERQFGRFAQGASQILSPGIRDQYSTRARGNFERSGWLTDWEILPTAYLPAPYFLHSSDATVRLSRRRLGSEKGLKSRCKQRKAPLGFRHQKERSPRLAGRGLPIWFCQDHQSGQDPQTSKDKLLWPSYPHSSGCVLQYNPFLLNGLPHTLVVG